MQTEEVDIRLKKTDKQKLQVSGHRPIPSSRCQAAHAAPLRTPSAACAPSCCRSGTSGSATTRTRPSSSSTAVGRVPGFAPTTTSPSLTCCSVGCCPTRHPGSSGTTRPAAGPPTTRTWPSWTTRTAGTRWRSCRPPAAAVWVRWLRVDGRRDRRCVW